MTAQNKPTCWVVTEGQIGMENQCLGLAAALGLTPVVKRIHLRAPWRQVAPFIRCGLAHAFSSKGDPIAPPWPDIMIACGRPSAVACLYARQASGKSGARQTFTVYLQNPHVPTSLFDLMVVPEHDRLTGPNVIVTRGGLHRLTPETLKREAARFAPQVAALPRPLVAVLIGGTNAVYRLTPDEMMPLAARLNAFAKATVAGLMVTPSRRTGEKNIRILQQGLADVPSYIWDGTGANPYFGMLGLADAFIVTVDSVNLASEACYTGKPVYVVDLPGGSDKFRRFHQKLQHDGLTRPFTGTLDFWTYPPLNEVEMVAAEVRKRFGINEHSHSS